SAGSVFVADSTYVTHLPSLEIDELLMGRHREESSTVSTFFAAVCASAVQGAIVVKDASKARVTDALSIRRVSKTCVTGLPPGRGGTAERWNGGAVWETATIDTATPTQAR